MCWGGGRRLRQDRIWGLEVWMIIGSRPFGSSNDLRITMTTRFSHAKPSQRSDFRDSDHRAASDLRFEATRNGTAPLGLCEALVLDL